MVTCGVTLGVTGSSEDILVTDFICVVGGVKNTFHFPGMGSDWKQRREGSNFKSCMVLM